MNTSIIHMLPVVNSSSKLMTLLDDGATVITMSNRQRSAIIAHWFSYRRSQALSILASHNQFAVPAPRITTLEDLLWQQGGSQLLPLDSLAEHWLWRSTFHKAYLSGETIENLGDLVQEARRFHEVCENWDIAPETSLWNTTADMYQRWRKTVRQQLAKIGAANNAMLLTHCAKNGVVPKSLAYPQQSITASAQNTISTVVLVGLVYTNPALDMLLTHWLKAKIKLYQWQPPATTKQNYIVCDGEYYQSLEWVAKQAKIQADKGKKVLIAMPDISADWNRVFSTFWQVIAPRQSLHSCLFDTQRAFNLSGGLSLASWPTLACALDLLALEPHSTMGDVLRLALHPSVHSDVPDKLVQTIHETAWDIPLSQGVQLWGDQWQWLKTINKALSTLQGKSNAAQWRTHFNNFLQLCCWQPYTNRFSIDYQLFQRWKKIMDSLASVEKLQLFANFLEQADTQEIANQSPKSSAENGFVTDMHKTDALYLLHTSANTDMYQPQVHNAPIQVLSLFEAIGLRADCTFIFGLDSHTLFTLQNGVTTVPMAVRREHDMPGCSPERRSLDAEALCTALLQTATECTLCHPRERDGVVLTTNPYIQQTPETVAIEQTPSAMPTPRYVHISSEHATLPTELQTNTSTLASCMQCGWQGWWMLSKLNCSYSTPRLYPDNRYTGLVIHHVLAEIGKLAKNHGFAFLQQQLTNKQIRKMVAQACSNMQEYAPQMRGQAKQYLVMYLCTLLEKWLENCAGDTQPEQIEQSYQLVIDRLCFHVRIDRVDRLANKQVCVLDYKTGNKSIELSSERMSDPQLLVYAAALAQAGEQVDGFGYGIMRFPSPEWKLIGTSQTFAYFGKSSTKNSYDDQKQWQQSLSQAIKAINDRMTKITNGEVSLDPIDEKVCTYCNLRASCRISASQ